MKTLLIENKGLENSIFAVPTVVMEFNFGRDQLNAFYFENKNMYH